VSVDEYFVKEFIETGDVHVSFRNNLTAFRNPVDRFNGLNGSDVHVGGIQNVTDVGFALILREIHDMKIEECIHINFISFQLNRVGASPYDPIIFNYFHYPVNLEGSREVRNRRFCKRSVVGGAEPGFCKKLKRILLLHCHKMPSRYINNNHQQKAMAKSKPKYVKPKSFLPTPRTEAPVKVQWYLVWDNATFHPGYHTGTARLVRM
jgi:hypothetical protein